MKYLVIDLSGVIHGEPVKTIAFITKKGIADLRRGGECSEYQPESPLIRLDEEGDHLAIPLTDTVFGDLPDYMDGMDD